MHENLNRGMETLNKEIWVINRKQMEILKRNNTISEVKSSLKGESTYFLYDV